MRKPDFILVFSGKRKSGKDYIADLFVQKLGPEKCQILRLSSPLKKQFAEDNDLDYNQLLNATSYKEEYRANMISWGEEKRAQDPNFFCNKTIEMADSSKPVWIVSDARRLTDVQFFRDNYADVVLFVRISASLTTQQNRGFVFTPGIDDAESECGLDVGVDWDVIINNDEDKEEEFNTQITQLVSTVSKNIDSSKYTS